MEEGTQAARGQMMRTLCCLKSGNRPKHHFIRPEGVQKVFPTDIICHENLYSEVYIYEDERNTYRWPNSSRLKRSNIRCPSPKTSITLCGYFTCHVKNNHDAVACSLLSVIMTNNDNIKYWLTQKVPYLAIGLYIKQAEARGSRKYWLLCQIVGLHLLTFNQSFWCQPMNGGEGWRRTELLNWAFWRGDRRKDRASHLSKRPSNFHHSL